MTDEPRRFEPWPWAIAALLAAMIGACLAFWWVAATHPDPLVRDAPDAAAEAPVESAR